MKMNILPISYPEKTIIYSKESVFESYNYTIAVKDGKEVVVLERLRSKPSSFLMGGDKDGPCVVSDEGGLFWTSNKRQTFAHPSLLIGIMKGINEKKGVFNLLHRITYSRYPYAQEAIKEAASLYYRLVAETDDNEANISQGIFAPLNLDAPKCDT